jgi:hypothetical protein
MPALRGYLTRVRPLADSDRPGRNDDAYKPCFGRVFFASGKVNQRACAEPRRASGAAALLHAEVPASASYLAPSRQAAIFSIKSKGTPLW